MLRMMMRRCRATMPRLIAAAMPCLLLMPLLPMLIYTAAYADAMRYALYAFDFVFIAAACCRCRFDYFLPRLMLSYFFSTCHVMLITFIGALMLRRAYSATRDDRARARVCQRVEILS